MSSPLINYPDLSHAGKQTVSRPRRAKKARSLTVAALIEIVLDGPHRSTDNPGVQLVSRAFDIMDR